MAEYIMLFRYTEQGIGNIKKGPQRIEEAKKLFAAGGAKIKCFYALLGRYDTMAMVEAPNDETMAKISLQVSSLGNVHAETLPAFTEEQFISMVNKLS